MIDGRDIDLIAHQLAGMNAGDRDRRMAVVLGGRADPDTAAGRNELHQRALLVTKLRERKLWPYGA